jgi:hypothetical protein
MMATRIITHLAGVTGIKLFNLYASASAFAGKETGLKDHIVPPRKTSASLSYQLKRIGRMLLLLLSLAFIVYGFVLAFHPPLTTRLLQPGGHFAPDDRFILVSVKVQFTTGIMGLIVWRLW